MSNIIEDDECDSNFFYRQRKAVVVADIENLKTNETTTTEIKEEKIDDLKVKNEATVAVIEPVKQVKPRKTYTIRDKPKKPTLFVQNQELNTDLTDLSWLVNYNVAKNIKVGGCCLYNSCSSNDEQETDHDDFDAANVLLMIKSSAQPEVRTARRRKMTKPMRNLRAVIDQNIEKSSNKRKSRKPSILNKKTPIKSIQTYINTEDDDLMDYDSKSPDSDKLIIDDFGDSADDNSNQSHHGVHTDLSHDPLRNALLELSRAAELVEDNKRQKTVRQQVKMEPIDRK